MDQNKITFIGFGNMGSAIYNGMQKSQLTNKVLIVEMDEKKLVDLVNKLDWKNLRKRLVHLRKLFYENDSGKRPNFPHDITTI